MAINQARAGGSYDSPRESDFRDAASRLAVYGSLAPGEENHHVVADLRGHWVQGSVRGELHDRGWGAGIGFPAMTWIPESEARIAVQILCSDDLPKYWDRLDEFEGEDYLRILVPVEVEGAEPLMTANIYRMRTSEV